MGNIAGIDPGFSGAISIFINNELMHVMDMPVLKNDRIELDEPRIRQLLSSYSLQHVYIEKAQAMPRQGVVSTGRYLASWGFLRGLCVGLSIPYTLVTPQRWKKDMLKDLPKGKDASIIRVGQLYPALELARKKDHGICDAVLIGRWGIENGGENGN